MTPTIDMIVPARDRLVALGNLRYLCFDYVSSLVIFDRAIAAHMKTVGPDSARKMSVERRLGQLYHAMGRLEEA